MLRIILLGRTGNNLFQYALGRVLAEKHGVPLVLDGSWYNAQGWAEVSHFLRLPIKAKVVRPCTLGSRALRKLTGKHYWEYRGVPVLKEASDDQSFNPRFLNAPADCVLFGYFQTPLYFQGIAGELRAEFRQLFADAFESSGQDARATVARASCPPSIHQRLSEPNSVAVHVRRGDYLHHPVFKVCDSAYYLDSMQQMRASLPAARFFIFSDDPQWCRENFKAPDVAAIIGRRCNEEKDAATGDRRHDHARANPLHDLYLMSLASHHIIANSTYSWWAAWLGEKPGQQVIMPERWYAHSIKAPIEEKRW